MLKKFRSTSKEDIDQFLCKNSDLHLRNIQISLYFEKFRSAPKKIQISF